MSKRSTGGTSFTDFKVLSDKCFRLFPNLYREAKEFLKSKEDIMIWIFLNWFSVVIFALKG